MIPFYKGKAYRKGALFFLTVVVLLTLFMSGFQVLAAPTAPFKAAPAIANELLNEAEQMGFNRGYYISRVAREIPKDSTREEIKEFLEDIGISFLSSRAPQADVKKSNFLIGFADKGDIQTQRTSTKRTVESMGGEIYAEFNIVNAIAARLPEAAIRNLERRSDILYVEPDAEVYTLAQEIPWGIERIFAGESYSYPTWEQSTGSGIGVAVLDTGIDINHEDLNVAGGKRFYVTGVRLRSDNNYNDDHGHGTHVAGTIASLDNNVGVVGVAPSIDLYAVKVLDNTGSGYISGIVAGIEWAVAHPAIDIINMSLGSSSYSQTFEDACNNAYAEGLLVISSAGNSGNTSGTGDNVGYPAKYASVIAVAASNDDDKRAHFSSTGPAVELIAPGVSILSTIPGNKYEAWSGTSMASPHVAGTAALVWAADPNLTNEEVRQILQISAEDLDLEKPHQGFGLVRADLAVKKAKDAPVIGVTGITIDQEDQEISIGATLQLTATISPADASDKSVSWSSGDLEVATVSTNGLVTGISAGNSIIKATSVDGNHEDTVEITVVESQNGEVTSINAVITSPEDGAEYKWNSWVDMAVKVTDQENNNVADANVTITIEGIGSYKGTTNTEGIFTARYRVANRSTPGTYTINAEAYKENFGPVSATSVTFKVTGR